MKTGDIVKLTKVIDNFEGHHPNGIDEGYTKTGTLINELEVGGIICIADARRIFTTSTIVEIVDDNTVKTRNSTYRIELIQSKGE